MKLTVATLVLVFFASSAFAQDSANVSAIAPGCGSAESAFEAASERSHPLAAPHDGKAIVYFIQDDRSFESRSRPTVDWGIDGQWVGVTQANNYFYFYVAPGVHHICTLWRTNAALAAGRLSSVASFTAESGKVYYFGVADVFNASERLAGMRLVPLDDDEAQGLLAQFRHSTSKPSK